ncbi:mechanosensitive ion channel family protein [Microbulbifer agarilyticus]|uniref:mechanosensitive ion channel family protein n=1 Tax=Microbulbifer agarilyticus TaxID=260552 RepID=UPI001C96888A|nr:mechanosensitive ion channel family protein [Microbulbifer agarilyticus]MBY6189737.1 mechanosensitive ion channel family protein [Microbulbifer agarilyticus]
MQEQSQDTATQIDADLSQAIGQVDNWVDSAVKLLPNFAVALVVLVVFYCVGAFLRFLVHRYLNRRNRSNLGEVLGSLVKWGVILAGLLIAATVVMPSLKPGDLIAGLGVGSVAIGFAFKDILQNWLAGLLILIRQPFEVGDQIQVADFEGTVKRIETRATIINTYDGQRMVIPNSDIYTSAILVKTARSMRRSDFDIGIGYSDRIDKACGVILETLQGIEGVAQKPAPEALPWGLEASWVTIRARWWTNSLQTDVTHVRAQFIERVKTALDEAGIDMPFETQVHLFHDQTDETDETDGERGVQREGWPKGKQASPRARWKAKVETKGDCQGNSQATKAQPRNRG